MTREEAMNNKDPRGYFVNKIFDDFESRICSNCIHYLKYGRQCLNEESIAYTSQEAVYYDDGCNKFGRKAKL